MCKHKSGGMNKPSAASADQPAIHSNAGITCSSHDALPESCRMISSNSSSRAIPQQKLMQFKDHEAHELALTPTTLQNLATSGSGATAAAALSMWNNESVKENGAKAMERLQHRPHLEESSKNCAREDADDEDDDDEITELSPFLFNKPFSICYSWQNYPSAARHVKKSSERISGLHCDMCDSPKFMRQRDLDCLSDSDMLTDKYFGNNASNSFFRTDRTNVADVFSEQTKPSSHFSIDSAIGSSGSNHFSLHVDDECDDAPSVESNSSESCFSATYSYSTMNTDPIPGPSGVIPRRNSIHFEADIADSDKDDDEFRGRSYSLTPTVNFAVFESESASETEDNDVFLPPPPMSEEETKPKEESNVERAEDQIQIPVSSFNKIFHISPSAAQLSIASSYGDGSASICKICHMTAKENDPLISPCRCSGTMQYIHCGCLMRWLEISSKRSRKPASCELCQYQYHWHKKFKVRHWQFPHCSRRDKILHFLFFLSMFVMIACATITIMCFKHDKGTKANPDRTELTQSEIVTLVCGVTFFLAFFVAMYVEVKSHSTIYKLLVKFIYLNQQWYIDEYEKKESAPVPV